jgi:spoIIIJ-associated protein
VAEPQVGPVLDEILKRMGLETTVDVREETDRSIYEIRGPEAALIIGKKGATLEALQYIVGKIVHRQEGPQRPFTIDAEGYRARREEALIELALRLSKKAIETNRPITVNPMSPHDRRIIHITLDKVPGVTTKSEGEGIFRRLIILPDPTKVVETPGA